MFRQRAISDALITAVFLVWICPVTAQTCFYNTFSFTYQGSDNQSVTRSLLTSKNELFCVGNINYMRNNLVMADGWVSLYTSRGTVVWSKRITAPGFDLLTIRDVTAASDSTYFITGFVQTYWGVKDLMPLNPNWGILLHMDRHGNLLWSKKIDRGFEPGLESSFLENIIRTGNGDFIANAVVWKRPPFQTKSMLLRLNIHADIKWATSYASDVFEFRFNLSNSIRQTTNGNIVAGGIIDQRIVNRDSILKVNYYWMGVDYATGKKLWDKSYLIREKAGNVFYPESSVRNITELPNGDLSFAGYADTNFITVPPITTKTINMVTSASGVIKKITAYQTDRPGSYVIDGHAQSVGGNQLVLMEDGTKATISQIDKDGLVLGKKAYATENGNRRPVGFIPAADAYYIFMNNNTRNGQTHIMRTDPLLDVSCKPATAQLGSFDGDGYLTGDDARMTFTTDTAPAPLFSPLAVITGSYPLQVTEECRATCCRDVVDTTQVTRITVCATQPYVLPDNQVAGYSGDYYVTKKSATGCDSISLYKVTIVKDPSLLSLGRDTCIEGRDSIILQATEGYDSYTWMNTVTLQPQFTAKQAGKYSVSVSNFCGSKTAGVEVFALCDHNLFIPSAFTPNGDNLNDVFRVPPTTKFRLVSFTVYNYWGGVIFSTTDIHKGWDGTYKRIQQQSGSYAYIIIAESLQTGRRKQLSGLVQLIR